MAFWRLKRNETSWEAYQTMVIRAPSEMDARKKAHDVEMDDPQSMGVSLDWMDPNLTTCVETPFEGETQVIWADFKEG